jgi:prolactin regulatory element-binding protein
MRVQHTSHTLASFPIYSSAFLSADRIAVGGGGGTSRSGIKNKIRVYDISVDRNIDLVDEFELAKDEDAPMSMAAQHELQHLVCGVNSVEELMKNGQNDNCRVYNIKDSKVTKLKSQGTLTNGDLEDFQRVTVLSPDGAVLAAAGRQDLSLLSYPSLVPIIPPIHVDQGEIYDVTFSENTFIVATSAALLVYSLPSQSVSDEPTSTPSPTKKRKKTKVKEPTTSKDTVTTVQLLKTVPVPSYFDATKSSTYRGAKYHPHDDNIVYAVVNTIPQAARKSKVPARQAFLVMLSTETWDVVTMRKLADKGLTCFDASADGKLLAYGTSDCTVGILDTKNLAPVATVLKAHEFPATTLKFNPSSTLLASGSADNSIRLVSLPKNMGKSSNFLWFLFLAVLAVLLAYLFQLLYSELHLLATAPLD